MFGVQPGAAGGRKQDVNDFIAAYSPGGDGYALCVATSQQPATRAS
jgi:hypothetical protein